MHKFDNIAGTVAKRGLRDHSYADRFAEGGRRFVVERDDGALVSRGPKDDGIARGVVATVGSGSPLLPRTGVRQIGAITARADASKCNNFGTLHVAYGTDTRVVCLDTVVSGMPYGPCRFGVDVCAMEHLTWRPGLGGQQLPRRLIGTPTAQVGQTLTERALTAGRGGAA